MFEIFGGAAKQDRDDKKDDDAKADAKPKAAVKKKNNQQNNARGVVKIEMVQPLPALAIPANAANANLDFLKPLINCELSFIHRVCEPDESQMEQIVEAAKSAHAEMGAMVIGNGANVRVVVGQQNVMFNGPNGERMNGNPYDRVRNDAKKYLKPLISETQYAKYMEEFEARKEYERGCSVDLAMAVLDRKVGLLDDQRDKIREIMMSKFNLDLGLMNIYIYNPQFAPPWPKEINQELSSVQKEVLADGPRVFNTMHVGNGPDLGLKDWLE
ncbi:MAG: hypothetical protein AAF802_14530 [Planctomycetota bacterium]